MQVQAATAGQIRLTAAVCARQLNLMDVLGGGLAPLHHGLVVLRHVALLPCTSAADARPGPDTVPRRDALYSACKLVYQQPAMVSAMGRHHMPDG